MRRVGGTLFSEGTAPFLSTVGRKAARMGRGGGVVFLGKASLRSRRREVEVEVYTTTYVCHSYTRSDQACRARKKKKKKGCQAGSGEGSRALWKERVVFPSLCFHRKFDVAGRNGDSALSSKKENTRRQWGKVGHTLILYLSKEIGSDW